MKTCLTFSFLILGVAIVSGLERVSLKQWTVSANDLSILIPDVNVPGGIFSDLMNARVIDDIFSGTFATYHNWVGLNDWTYDTTFTATDELLANRIVFLVFEGLDTFATISVNGEEVGRNENMFVRQKINIKKQLKVGYNEISVQFSSAVNVAKDLAANPNNPYVIPPECPNEVSNGICHVNRIRKMQASFSWDWGPGLASVGIWKDVYLEPFNNCVIDYVVANTEWNIEQGIWNITADVYLNAGEYYPETCFGSVSATLDIATDLKTVSVHTKSFLKEDNPTAITVRMDLPVTDDSITHWWPNGYGAHTLYDLTIAFYKDNPNTEKDVKVVKIGFRTIELVQEELEHGFSFYFKVNGVPIFAKGANEVPINILPEKGQDPDVVRKMLQSVREANMNMLRVWGGGVYESDLFYDLADEFGILIWQDFMFASALYPADEAYLNNVAAEVDHQVRRFGSHPSIAIWSGNNENEAALAQDWFGTSNNFQAYLQDYIKLYELIESHVLANMPGATFITSSPTNGLESDQASHVAMNPEDPQYGDVHFYDYSSDSWSVSTFPIPRFASEYGYQSMPSIESWLTATGRMEDLHPDGPFVTYRQNHPDGNRQNLNLINMQLQLPDSTSDNYTKTFIYYSQIIQAQSIKMETEHYRSFKGRVDEQGRGNTMGALFWQLNDVWVAPTWSAIDYTGRWKMLQYYVKDFFSTTIVTGRLTYDKLEVYAITDSLVPTDSKAVVHIFQWSSLVPLSTMEFPVTLDPHKSVLATTINASNALTDAGCGRNYAEAKTNCFFHLNLNLVDQSDTQLAPPNYVFPEKLKDSHLAHANVEVTSVAFFDEKVFQIMVTTDAPALFVWLDSHNIKGHFSENGFLQVVPMKSVLFTSDDDITVDDLTAALTVTHLRDDGSKISRPSSEVTEVPPHLFFYILYATLYFYNIMGN